MIARIHFLERPVDRQHHEGEARIDEAEQDRAIRVQEGDGLLDQPDPFEHQIDEALVAEQQDPAIGADQEVGPERHRDEQDQHLPEAGRSRRHVPGERQSEHEAQHRRQHGLDHRPGEDLQVGRIEDERVVEIAVVDEADVGLRRERVFDAAIGARGHEAVDRGDAHGEQHEDRDGQQGRACQQQSAIAWAGPRRHASVFQRQQRVGREPAIARPRRAGCPSAGRTAPP